MMDGFGRRLKALRESRKIKDSRWTQEYVADLIGVARSTYTAYENGTKQPPLETVSKIADLFDSNVDYLLGRNHDPKPRNVTYDDLDEDERRFIEQLREVANEYGVELTDPTFLKALDAAFDLAKRIRGSEDQRNQ